MSHNVIPQLVSRSLPRLTKYHPRGHEDVGIGIEFHCQLGCQLSKHGALRRFKHTVEAAQHGEREDDLAIIGLLGGDQRQSR